LSFDYAEKWGNLHHSLDNADTQISPNLRRVLSGRNR